MKFFKLLYSLLSKLLMLIILLLISLIFYFSMPIKTTETVILPQGSITKVISHLKAQGYALTFLDTYLLAYALNPPKSGTLHIGTKQMSRIEFLKKLSTAKEAIDVITLIPGETRPIFLEELAKRKKLNLSKLESAYAEFSSYKEAGIIPETYHLPKNISEKKLITFLVSESEKKYKELAIKHLQKYDKKEWLRILTIASVIQKEAANNQEMPIVASVVYNRLEIDMPLQMDGTLNYGKYSHVKVTPKRIKTDTSGFNTYANKGLPPYPVCSVSITAIEAALKPAITDYLYFMKNQSGVHDFTSSYNEHLRNIRKAKAF
ncbi:MAG: FIG004453: protein YceG like [uncultured Sulfurovum sp.]|uniref:Endolytic murein transglycosylase n=1 Tax=uncultured Sulfurovum sp. TaxID=269237 RepID=A0A6S6TGW9_9BACT|nr:MAG: FIG004453: protein YceG like [uncultured Sulfurovum sp.]